MDQTKGRLDLLAIGIGERLMNSLGSNLGVSDLGSLVKPQIEELIREYVTDRPVEMEPWLTIAKAIAYRGRNGTNTNV